MARVAADTVLTGGKVFLGPGLGFAEAVASTLPCQIATGTASEIADLISTTVAGWDADDTSERIELQVGRDLQYIRINGTVVGGLVGLLIHAVAQILG